MFKKLLSVTFCSLLLSAAVFAQSGSVSGVVTDGTTGDPLPAVTVQLVEIKLANATNVDGEYTIANVPAGTYTLRATFVGFRKFETQVTVGSGDVVQDIVLVEDVLGLEEVVVTGVGAGTETTKLGFSVSKVNDEALSEVPAADVGSAIRAKVPGITVVKASGDPSAGATIRLRSSTSLSNNQSPLIIVDGVITDGSLADINMQDVESIEVVKGAAGASLYGSLAGNGVIQIITKRASKSVDKPEVTVRSEYGVSSLAKEYPLATTHPWDMTGVVVTDGYITDWPNFENSNFGDGVFDNEFPVTFNNTEAIFTGQAFNSNYVSVANASGNFNYFASFEGLVQNGVIQNLDSYKRNSVRFNADYFYNEKFKLNFSGSYINADYPRISEQGQGSNFFYSALTAAPFINFEQTGANGQPLNNNLTGYDIAGSNFQNPLYVAKFRENNEERDRYIMGITLNYQVNDWLAVDARQSFDKSYTLRTLSTPVGYQTPTPSQSLNNGSEGRTVINNTTSISEAWATGRFSTDEINLRVIAKYLYEDREYESYGLSGDTYSVAGIRNFNALDQTSFSISNYFSEDRAENYILDAEMDYLDKLIISGMVRRDGSSLFGEDERYQIYYRGSLAYRLTEDIEIDNVQELKVRASYGISGQRPPFSAQYETYSAGSTVLLPNILGNSEIKPSVVAETELGVDVSFLDKFNFTANYAVSTTSNDYILAPLTSDNPFSAQWQNVGEIEGKTLEFALQGVLLNTRDMQGGFNLSFATVDQKVTDLGDVPAFTRSAGGAIDLFRFEEGVSYGAMYGNKLISSVSQLTTDTNGFVLNAGGGTLTPADFSVNSLGHVVITSDAGTDAERPMYLVDENGDEEIVQIGDTNPDFNVGITGNFSYKNLGLFMVWDWSQGGEVYNYTKQLLIFNYRHKELETLTRDGYKLPYITSSDGLYNASDALSYYVEDASYLKLREVSLSYTFDNDMLSGIGIGNAIKDIKLSVVGRNLLTFTDYSGYDPEVALRSNATNFRLDEYSYPNFRTFTGSIQVRF
jgi:TonB-linked SusC/RagA family outer membrane protein